MIELAHSINFTLPVSSLEFVLQEATLSGKAILVALFVASIFSWSVMVTKYKMIKHAREQNRFFMEDFRSDRDPLKLYEAQERYEGAPLYYIYRAACKEMTFQLLGSSEIDETFKARLATSPPLSSSQMRVVTSAMERAVGETALRLEGQMIILATAVSGSPFLGLLGTVWGVMDTFTGIAREGSSNIAAMAPGVAGALATTVLGLLVAIPAMFGYNYLLTHIRTLIVQMDNFAAELASKLEHKYASHNERKSSFLNPS